jgi:hypothetical protein
VIAIYHILTENIIPEQVFDEAIARIEPFLTSS